MVRGAEGVFTIDSLLGPGKRTAFKKRYDGTWDNKVAPMRMEVKIATR